MGRRAQAAAVFLGVLLVAETPAMSVAPGMTPAIGQTERWMSVLSTRAPNEGCSTKGDECTFRPCCAGEGTCRSFGGGRDGGSERACR
jgi:hypothetical protein